MSSSPAKTFLGGLPPLFALACLVAVTGCAGGGGDAADDPGIIDSSTQEADQLREDDAREEVGEEAEEERGDRGRR